MDKSLTNLKKNYLDIINFNTIKYFIKYNFNVKFG